MKTEVLSLLVICCLSSVFSSEQQSKVHDQLSDAQFKSIFRRDRRDVPDYQFVNIKSKTGHRAKREIRPVEFKVDNKNVELNLRPARHTVMSDYTPVWLAETIRGKQYSYKTAGPEEKKIGGVFYEDPENMATLLAYYKDRYIYYDGIFGESEESKVVKSAPESWRIAAGNGNDEKHFIFNVSSSGKTVALQPKEINEVDEKLDKPLETFYPKLIVVVDYSLYETLGKDIHETVKYVATFWNAVNLKYSKIEQPKIKIIVTGLIISKDPTAMKYIYSSRDQKDLIKLNANALLLAAGKYFRDEFYNSTKFENYDAIITMSSLYTGMQLGVAYVGAICGKNLNVGYVYDDASFGGVTTATHELGHLLSLPHDESSNCNSDDEHQSTIMSPVAARVKEFIWSECSKKSLQKFAWSKKSSCMESHYRRRH